MKKIILMLGLAVFGFASENVILSVDTLFLIACSGLVLLMTPALGMFYAGMVNRNNVLSTTINSVILYALIEVVQWITKSLWALE